MECETSILTAPEPAEQKPKTLEWLVLFAGLFVLTDLKLLYALTLPGPWFLPDEVLYINEARSLAQTGALIRGTQPGWPMLLAGVVRVLGAHPRAMYFAGVALATTLGTLAWIFGYLIARRWASAPVALAATLIAASSPGLTILGWSVLSEPLFIFLMMMTGWLLVRATERGKALDWIAALTGSLACLAVRPFGMCCIAATLAGLIVWAIQENRRGLAWVAAGIAVAIITACLNPWGVRWTNYRHERQLIRQFMANVQDAGGWAKIGGAIIHDLTYLFVATFGVMWAMSFALVIQTFARWRRLSCVARTLLVAACVLAVSMLALSAAMWLIAIDEQMYGRYVEPLAGWATIAGCTAWSRQRKSVSFRWISAAALGVGLLAASNLPPASFTEMNSSGYWYWHELSSAVHPLAACGICVLAWLVWATPAGGRWGIWLLLPLSIAGTATIAVHLHRQNRGLAYLRKEADGIASAVQANSPPWVEIWIDPRLARGSNDAWLSCEYRTWLLRYDLPEAIIGYGQPTAQAPKGIFFLTGAKGPSSGAIWTLDDLSLHLH
jgi:hypothetical protein